MSRNTSSVMEEFFKIAETQNLLGLRKTAAAEKNPYQEDLKTIEEKRLKSPDKHIMEVAHPEPVYIAEAQGDGALVENEIEKQQKTIEMVNKHPTGSLVGRYAEAINTLVKLANMCDGMGEVIAADFLTEATQELVDMLEEDKFPLA